jgi:hypothetical protein
MIIKMMMMKMMVRKMIIMMTKMMMKKMMMMMKMTTMTMMMIIITIIIINSETQFASHACSLICRRLSPHSVITSPTLPCSFLSVSGWWLSYSYACSPTA